ncbi:MAG: transcription termination factor NusA [Patescibacteria group bacterium]|nr:transcription termination factor NusA [Patescibacteria group bacterium]
MSSPIYQAIRQVSEEKDIPEESVIETIEAALAAAYRKDFGEKDQNVKVTFEPESGDFDVFDVKTVVEDMEIIEEIEDGENGEEVVVTKVVKKEVKVEEGDEVKKEEEMKKEVKEEEEDDEAFGFGMKEPAGEQEAGSGKQEGVVEEVVEEESTVEGEEAEDGESPSAEVAGDEEEDEGPKFNPKTDIMITDAQELKKGAEIGEEIKTQLEVPAAFGRMAAQTAKQVIIQKIREAERTKLFNEFRDREKELVNATVQRREGRLVLIDLGRVTAIMPPDEQVPSERYTPGDRVKVYVISVELTTRGPEIVVSRSHPEIIRKLFGLEIPEIAAGTVTIHAVAREAGARSKVAVSSNQENVDPIGSCIGQRGTRIQTVIAELGGEKVDVIQFDEDPAMFITNALSPAKVIEIELDEENQVADVLVDEDQLSLAIGRGGQNVRLASRLTGWKINIRKIGDEGGEAFTVDEKEEGGAEAQDEEGEKEAEGGAEAEKVEEETVSEEQETGEAAESSPAEATEDKEEKAEKKKKKKVKKKKAEEDVEKGDKVEEAEAESVEGLAPHPSEASGTGADEGDKEEK